MSEKAAPVLLKLQEVESMSLKLIPSALSKPAWKVTKLLNSKVLSPFIDIFITATGNKGIIMADHMSKMKNNAIVGNIGHFDNEIDMAGLKSWPGIKRINIKPQLDKFVFPDGHAVLILAEGRLLNLGCATGHPSFVMSASFTNQVLAQIELFKNKDTGKYKNEVYVLPKQLDEKVAALHLPALGAQLSTLSKDQAEYLGVGLTGPFKKDSYRY